MVCAFARGAHGRAEAHGDPGSACEGRVLDSEYGDAA
jgi:hypothetical protein